MINNEQIEFDVEKRQAALDFCLVQPCHPIQKHGLYGLVPCITNTNTY